MARSSRVGAAWIKPAHPRFLAPGYMLSEIFRAKMRAALVRAGLDSTIDPTVWTRRWTRRWTVHVQQIGSGDHAVRYLSRYVYRVALSNHALECCKDGRVTFRYTHARSHETRRLTLPVDAFIGRFLQHVLPSGFTKIRSYGLLSPSSRPDLERARQLLQLHARQSAQTSAVTNTTPATTATPDYSTTSHDVDTGDTSGPLAPACQQGHLHIIERFQRSRAPP